MAWEKRSISYRLAFHEVLIITGMAFGLSLSFTQKNTLLAPYAREVYSEWEANGKLEAIVDKPTLSTKFLVLSTVLVGGGGGIGGYFMSGVLGQHPFQYILLGVFIPILLLYGFFQYRHFGFFRQKEAVDTVMSALRRKKQD